MFEHDYSKYPELTNTQLQTQQFTTPHVQITEDFFATVVKVHDGDTVTLSTDFRDFTFPLRLLGIDAPELNAGGQESREYLKSMCEGKDVMIQVDKNQRVGKYGRLLGTIMVDGVSANDTMVRMGYAVPFNQRREGQIPDMNMMMQEVAI